MTIGSLHAQTLKIIYLFAAQKRSDWLLKGIVNEYPLDKCKKLLKTSNKEIIDSQFCAQSSSGVDGCQGDSGGNK